MACVLSFRRNKGHEEARKGRKCIVAGGIRRCNPCVLCPPFLPLAPLARAPLATALLALDRDKAVGITLFPQCLAPFYRTNPSYEGVRAHTLPIYQSAKVFPRLFFRVLATPCLRQKRRGRAHALVILMDPFFRRVRLRRGLQQP